MAQIPDSELHRIVKQIVERTLGVTSSGRTVNPSPLVSTDAAVLTKPSTVSTQPSTAPSPEVGGKVVAFGSDHGGYLLKETLKAYIADLGYGVMDCGTNDPKTAVDYPDFALAAALLIKEGKAWRAIVVDGAGIGSCMAANKVPGVRAALCYDYATAVNSREHNDANLLTLGAGLIGDNLSKQIVKTWLGTEFGGGRHQKRIDKIIGIEKRFSKE